MHRYIHAKTYWGNTPTSSGVHRFNKKNARALHFRQIKVENDLVWTEFKFFEMWTKVKSTWKIPTAERIVRSQRHTVWCSCSHHFHRILTKRLKHTLHKPVTNTSIQGHSFCWRSSLLNAVRFIGVGVGEINGSPASSCGCHSQRVVHRIGYCDLYMRDERSKFHAHRNSKDKQPQIT